MSRAWSAAFRVQYRLILLFDPLIRIAMRLLPWWMPRAVDLRMPGHASGRPRRVLVTLLSVGGGWFVGHPDGTSSWTRNLEVAGAADVTFRNGRTARVRPVRLFGGPEREAVIRATWSQQPFPGNVMYALARRHVRATGVYFRLLEDDRTE